MIEKFFQNFLKSALFFVLFLIPYSLFLILPVHAAQLDLSGFAWSDVPQASAVDRGAGWIKFSGTYGGGTGPYAVKLDTSTGALTGYAWSENYGWLSFQAADVSGCPTSPCNPTVSLSTGVVTGWARFVAAPGGTSGPWNGWVHLNPSKGGVTYTQTTGKFSGYAWGDSDIGWIEFCGAWTTDCVATAPVGGPTTINIVTSPSNATWTLNRSGSQQLLGTGNAGPIATTSDLYNGTIYSIVAGSPPAGYAANPTITVDEQPACSSPCTSITSFGTNDTITFRIVYSLAFNYSLSANPNPVNIEAGQSGSTGIVKTLTAGVTQSVNTFLDQVDGGSQPAWMGYSLANEPCSPTCTTSMNMTISNTAPTGDHTIRVRTTSASLADKFLSFTLHINPVQSISCHVVASAPNGNGFKVGETIVWTTVIDAGPLGTGASNYTFGLWDTPGATQAGPPPPTGQSITLTDGYSTTGAKTATNYVQDTQGRPGVCPGGVTIGVTPGFQEE